MIYIPPRESKRLIQTNKSDILASLVSSYNLDLDTNLGAIRVSPRLKLNTNGLDGCPWGFRYFDSAIFAGAGTLIYANGGLPSSQSFSADASSGFQSDYSSDESDMEVFNATLCATTTDALYSKAANGSGTGAWTARDVLNTGGQHVMCTFKKTERLYYSNQADNIISISTGWATADPGADYAISLSDDSNAYTITSMKSTSSSIFIGILDKTKEGSVGKILEWDGISSVITNEFPLAAQGCLAILIDKERDIPFAIDSNGSLLRFNGAGFDEVGQLPIRNKKLLKAMNDVDNERFIHPNGMMMGKGGTVIVNVNGANADTTNGEYFQSGLYVFTPISATEYSCHHIGSPSYTSDTTISDYGQSRISRVGALASANIYSSSATRNGTFLVGSTYFTNATSTSSGIFFDDSNNTLQKAGYFVSTWILASEIKDTWQKIVAKYRKLLDSADKIVVKYRTTEVVSSSDITITWYNGGTTFKTSTSLSSYAVGDEVEIVQGVGSGLCAHITAMTDLGGGVTEIVIDETISTAVNTDTALARFQKWKKLTPIANQTSESAVLPIGASSERIQLKVWMLFEGNDELFELALINKGHTLMI